MSIRSVDEIFGLGVRQSIVVLIPEISIAIAIVITNYSSK